MDRSQLAQIKSTTESIAIKRRQIRKYTKAVVIMGCALLLYSALLLAWYQLKVERVNTGALIDSNVKAIQKIRKGFAEEDAIET